VARADLAVASAAVSTAWTAMLPRADLRAEHALDLDDIPDDAWRVSLRASWTLPGVVGGFAHVRARQLERRIAEVQLEGLQRDLERDRAVAGADLDASVTEVEWGRARESLAAGAVQLAQTRLAAGVADPLDVLRLQDDLARAQRTRVEAERNLALARLELRRLHGTPW
jgi:outer membrane protein TolC